MIQQILLQLVLILLNAFFAAAEIALISINENKVRALADDGDKKAKKMLKIIENPTKFLSAIQIGITLAGFLGSAFAADSFADRLTGAIVSGFNLPDSYVGVIDTVSVIVITLILSYFTLVLGELVPKRVAMRHKEKLARGVLGVISAITTVLKPIIWFLTASTNLVLRLFGINPNEKEESVSEEDIVVMLDAGADEGTLDKDDITYIKNVFKLEKLTAADVMTPRSSVVAIPEDITKEELFALIEEEGYSRLPVYSENVDTIIGVLHAKTYLLKHSAPGFKITDATFEPEFVPETIHLDVLFKNMKKTHTHIVIVVNEYGYTAGIVTMEDILEELVGKIWDEHDEATEEIIPLGEDTYRVLASLSIDEFFEYFSLAKDEEIESTTVNGWLSEVCESIPECGFSFNYQNLRITVTSADDLKASEIEVIVLPVSPEDDENTDKETALPCESEKVRED